MTYSRRLSSSIVLLLVSASFSAGEVTWAAQLPKRLLEVEKSYAKAGSLSADFLQEDTSTIFSDKKSSRGNLSWKAPDFLRWETKSPQPNLLVSNGKKVWLYTPPFDETENGQVIIRKASEVKSRLLDALLAGRFSVAQKKGLKISSLSSDQFVLRPQKDSRDNIKRVLVTLDENRPVISKVSIE